MSTLKKCLKHNYQKYFYCINCKENICEECSETEEHNNHITKNLCSEMPSQNQIDEMKKRIIHYD